MDTVREAEAVLIDILYDLRQDGELSDNQLKAIYAAGGIRQWTYERLLALKPDDNAGDWSHVGDFA